jgi:phosphoadenosine phosphosulfate reductase
MTGNLKLTELKDLLSDNPIEEQLVQLSEVFKGKIIFTTSFGIEDQVITHKIFSADLPVKVVTLDTGRLFPQTYEVFSNTLIRYRKKIDVFFPDREKVEKMVSEKGPHSFYRNVEDRKECCHVRKIEPLGRALKGFECWISGIRSDQSDGRSNMNRFEFDAERNIYKYYPLFDWSYSQVIDYAKENKIPYNTLHDKGFVSIGCEPCTKAIKQGESFRAGRWWWENDGPKECGLHERVSG